MFISDNSAIVALYLCTCCSSICQSFATDLTHPVVKRQPMSTMGLSTNEEAKVSQYPGIVSFSTSNSPGRICSGFIVDPFTVVTAAHCLVNLNSSSNSYKVGLTFIIKLVAGTRYRVDTPSENNQVHAKRFTGSDFILYIHPRYFQDARLNDIALLKKRLPFSFSNTLSRIPLDFKYPNAAKEGNPFYMVGFGKKNNTSDLKLMQRHVPSGYQSSPGEGLIHLQSEDVCLFQDNSGAPLLKKKNDKMVAIGVTVESSPSESCSRNGDAKFTMLHEHSQFLQNRLGENRELCGELDTVKYKDFNDPNLYVTKYPWLMALFDEKKRFFCHATYVGFDTLIASRRCFRGGKGKPISFSFIASAVEMLAIGATVVKPLAISQFGLKPFSVKVSNGVAAIKLKFNLRKYFYVRPVCFEELQFSPAMSTELLTDAGFFLRRNRHAFGLQERNLQLVKNTSSWQHLCATQVEHRPDMVINFYNLGQPLMSVRGGRYYLEGVLQGKNEDVLCPSLYSIADNLMLI